MHAKYAGIYALAFVAAKYDFNRKLVIEPSPLA